MENGTEMLDSTNEQEVVEETESLDSAEDTQVTDTQSEEVDIDALKEQNKKLFARAKKAEGFVLKDGKWIKAQKLVISTERETPKNNSLSDDDLLELVDVPRESRNFLKDEAKLRGISIAELKKNPYIKITLQTMEEERKTAQATNTSGSRRGTQNVSAEQIVSAGLGGKEVDPVKFAEAQMELRKQKKS